MVKGKSKETSKDKELDRKLFNPCYKLSSDGEDEDNGEDDFSENGEDEDPFVSSDDNETPDYFSEQSNWENFENPVVQLQETCMIDAPITIKHAPTSTHNSVLPTDVTLRNMNADKNTPPIVTGDTIHLSPNKNTSPTQDPIHLSPNQSPLSEIIQSPIALEEVKSLDKSQCNLVDGDAGDNSLDRNELSGALQILLSRKIPILEKLYINGESNLNNHLAWVEKEKKNKKATQPFVEARITRSKSTVNSENSKRSPRARSQSWSNQKSFLTVDVSQILEEIGVTCGITNGKAGSEVNCKPCKKGAQNGN
ncbi:hypothetical protein L2E82_52369 [Cichorium intybus]|nr:hypothetical protein L2E82_52369 [Cichorium intybus]